MSLRLLFLFCWITNTLFAQSTASFLLEIEKITPNSLHFVGKQMPAGTLGLYYGSSPALELGAVLANAQKSTTTTLVLPNLQPAHFYYVQPFVWTGIDTLWGMRGYYSTQSLSTGEIEVLFNQGIDPSYSTGSSPAVLSGGSNVENAIITKINQAQHTVDCCIFNTTRTPIFNALQAAHNRGVRVRFIANAGTFTSNAALRNGQPLFPVFYVNANDLMHNKFVVIDAQSVDSSWVWTGSCNWTYTDMYTNYNNVVTIQDQALAQAYTLEFQEMWGSTGVQFDSSVARAGANKLDNTPHVFNIGGRTVECYFSPSDDVTNKIETSLLSANSDLEFSLLSFTRNELGSAILNRHQNGILEHGMMENIFDNGSEYNYLRNAGVNILADNQPTDLHHKYAIIDAGNANSDPQVVTGSHNWTTAAETRNDENTLIIHDATIANLFLQEFALRWCQNKNNTACALPFPRYNSTRQLPQFVRGLTIYPNPASQEVTLSIENASQEAATILVYSLTGQLLQQKYSALQDGQAQLSLSTLASGCYWIQVQQGNLVYQQKLVVL